MLFKDLIENSAETPKHIQIIHKLGINAHLSSLHVIENAFENDDVYSCEFSENGRTTYFFKDSQNDSRSILDGVRVLLG